MLTNATAPFIGPRVGLRYQVCVTFEPKSLRMAIMHTPIAISDETVKLAAATPTPQS
jgi:hypothetical protein